MTQAKCTIVKNFEAITSLTFQNNDYIDRMNELGFTLLFYGIDLITLAGGTNPASRRSPDQPAAIVLELVPEKGDLYPDQQRYNRGYRDLPLLLKTLKNWDWSPEGRHALHIQDDNVNIELNIAVYTLGWDVGRMATPANHRLVVNNENGPAESAICYGKEDPSLGLNCFMSKDETILYFGTIGGRFVCRNLMLYAGRLACNCGLEDRLCKYQSTRENPKEGFEQLEPDGVLSDMPQFEGCTLHPSLSDAQIRHTSAWRHVIRDDSSFRRLLKATELEESSLQGKQPEKNFFLVRLGAQALYNGDWKDSKKVCHTILCWTPNVRGPTLNRDKFDIANIATMTRTDSSPSILLHAWPHNMNWKIRVENLDSYIENKNGSPTIPVLYLRDADYLIRDTVMEYKYNDNLYSGPRHAYSFVAKGLTIIMAEFDEEREPWHERSNGQNSGDSKGKARRGE